MIPSKSFQSYNDGRRRGNSFFALRHIARRNLHHSILRKAPLQIRLSLPTRTRPGHRQTHSGGLRLAKLIEGATDEWTDVRLYSTERFS